MLKVLIINGKKDFQHSKGELNQYLVNFAEEFLTKNEQEVKVTNVDNGYDIEEEVQKYLWADIVVYQFPIWWMAAPWIIKKYIDEVFTTGHTKLYQSDGRSSSNPNHNYGSGGLLQGKKYMLSVTWNAPENAFVDSGEFFEGKGIDTVLMPMHKANQFLGMTSISTFMCNDVIKNPHIEEDVARYQKHLQEFILDNL